MYVSLVYPVKVHTEIEFPIRKSHTDTWWSAERPTQNRFGEGACESSERLSSSAESSEPLLMAVGGTPEGGVLVKSVESASCLMGTARLVEATSDSWIGDGGGAPGADDAAALWFLSTSLPSRSSLVFRFNDEVGDGADALVGSTGDLATVEISGLRGGVSPRPDGMVVAVESPAGPLTWLGMGCGLMSGEGDADGAEDVEGVDGEAGWRGLAGTLPVWWAAAAVAGDGGWWFRSLEEWEVRIRLTGRLSLLLSRRSILGRVGPPLPPLRGRLPGGRGAPDAGKPERD